MLKQIRFPLWSKVSITHLERDWIGTVKQLFRLMSSGILAVSHCRLKIIQEKHDIQLKALNLLAALDNYTTTGNEYTGT